MKTVCSPGVAMIRNGRAGHRQAGNTSNSHIRRGYLTYAALVRVRLLVARSVGRDRGPAGSAEQVTGVRERGDPAQRVGLGRDPPLPVHTIVIGCFTVPDCWAGPRTEMTRWAPSYPNVVNASRSPNGRRRGGRLWRPTPKNQH